MDKKLKAKWIKALRSGKYKQAHGKYYDGLTRGYCCLGVLARVDQDTRPGLLSYGSAERKVESGHKVDQLIHMNDYDRKSFAEIADWIEKNV